MTAGWSGSSSLDMRRHVVREGGLHQLPRGGAPPMRPGLELVQQEVELAERVGVVVAADIPAKALRLRLRHLLPRLALGAALLRSEPVAAPAHIVDRMDVDGAARLVEHGRAHLEHRNAADE